MSALSPSPQFRHSRFDGITDINLPSWALLVAGSAAAVVLLAVLLWVTGIVTAPFMVTLGSLLVAAAALAGAVAFGLGRSEGF